MLSLLSRQCKHSPKVFFLSSQKFLFTLFTQNALAQLRPFATSQILLARRHQQPKIRVPSKKALAAKARRRAGIAAKADDQTQKLTLLEAIAVLRVSAPPTLLEQLQLYHLARPLKLHHRIRSMSSSSRLRLKMASLCRKDVSIFQGKLNPELRKRFSYLRRGDKRKRQKRRVRILWVARSLSTECVPSVHHIHICSTEHSTDS